MWTKYVLWEERLNDDGKEFNIFSIITMLGSYLPPVVCRNAHVKFTLFVLVCEKWCQTHIALCCFDLSSSYVLCTQCCQCFSRLSILDCAFAFIQHLSTKRSDALYPYTVGKYTFICASSITGRKKQALGRLFWPVSKRVQINFIFTDDVRIMCFYCNIKKSRRTAKLSEKSRNKHDSNGVFYYVRTYTVLFLTVALNESGTSKAL